MTLSEAQNFLHTLYQGDTEYPTSGDDEWSVRLSLLNIGINHWDNEKGVMWNELWVELSDAVTGDKTTLAATLAYDAPTDFRFAGSFIRLTDSAGQSTYYQVYKPEEAALYKNSGTQAVYFTGNASVGYTLHFMTQPTVGVTINYPYYKTPSALAISADIFEMADPYFALYFALGKLHETDGEGDRASLAYQMANERMGSMKMRNQLPVWFTANAVRDRDWGLGEVTGGGFGT